MTPNTEAEDLQLLLDGILLNHGYDLRGYAPDHMTRRFRLAMQRRGAANARELLDPTLDDPQQFWELLDDLTVQVSELFRDPEVYQSIRNGVLPILRTYPQIKLWHAGCAWGEEAYSMAILLGEEQLDARAQLYGTDVSQTAIRRATQGTYKEQDFPRSRQNYERAGGKARLEDYCSFAYAQFALQERVRRQVVFFQHNLASDHSLGEMQFVLCRNVVMYFGDALRERVFDLFAQSLCHRGFLCLGPSERVIPSRAHLFEEFDVGARIYRLRGDA